MKTFEEHHIEQFDVELIRLKHKKGERVILRTPCIDYCFSKDGWERLKEKLNKNLW